MIFQRKWITELFSISTSFKHFKMLKNNMLLMAWKSRGLPDEFIKHPAN